MQESSLRSLKRTVSVLLHQTKKGKTETRMHLKSCRSRLCSPLNSTFDNAFEQRKSDLLITSKSDFFERWAQSALNY